jgi:DNA-binding CsgD family transcriptional regulator
MKKNDNNEQAKSENRQIANKNLSREELRELLYKKELELEALATQIDKLNSGVEILLIKNKEFKKRIEEDLLSNIREFVLPYLERLKKCGLSGTQKALVNCMETGLKNITSPLIRRLSSKFVNLTPMEIQVANLVKQGKTNKEIADLLCLSINTILTHRSKVRVKLGLKHKNINLRSCLLSFEE